MTTITCAAPPGTRPPALRLLAPVTPLPRFDPAPAAPPASGGFDAVPPQTERAARAVTAAVAEVLAGRRPAAQLQAVMPERLLVLVEHLVRSGLATGLALASCRVQAPREGVVEASFRLADAERSRAGALRLERRAGRWRCVCLEVALSPSRSRPARGTA